MATDTFDPILSEREYRDWLGISAPTAQRQRAEGTGPPFVQLSRRRIGYRKSAVERWLEARTVSRVGGLALAPKPTSTLVRGGNSHV
jgi:predicted DNA-binding transcriptional regulator AlpA